MRFLLLSFALVFSSACSREPQTGPAPATPVSDAPTQPAFGHPPVQTTRAPDGRPVVLTFGDSLSAGFGVDPGYSYPDFLQRELDQRGLAYRVVNAGISGDTTSGGVARIQNGLRQKPAVVILELGGNDGLRGVPIAQMRANLDRMVTEFKRGGAQVLLAGMTLPPNYGPDYVREFEQVYVELARKHGIPRIPFLMEDVWNKPGMIQADGIHLTVKGNQDVAKTVMRYLEPMLKGR